jgi:nitrite reductase/ring-hydroxylating ferredoxin subunit
VSARPPGERALAAGGAALTDRQSKRWQTAFPYHWDADELVSRRQLLRFAVFTSGALFASTAALAVLGSRRSLRRADLQPIVQVGEVPEGQAYYFLYPDPEEQAMLLHLPGGRFVAYSQRCTHLSCAVYYQPERQRLFCPCHDGVFNPETGDPVAGPPQRRLERILLRREGDLLIAVGREP